jgi:hypothetical protein
MALRKASPVTASMLCVAWTATCSVALLVLASAVPDLYAHASLASWASASAVALAWLAREVVMTLRLLTKEEHATRVSLPTEATADLTLWRLSRFSVAAGERVFYEYGDRRGSIVADGAGRLTLPAVRVSATPTVLRVYKS